MAFLTGLTNAQRRMLVIGLVPLLLLVAGGAAVAVGSIRGHIQYNYSQTFAPASQGVSVVSDVPVNVRTSTDDRVHVDAGGSYAVAQPTVDVSTIGGQLEVRAFCSDIHCEADVAVAVPAAVPVQVKTERSSIDVVGASGPLTVDTTDGSVDMMQLRSKQVSVNCRRGSITLSFADAPDHVTANSTDGSLTVQVPQSARYAVDAIATQGSTDLEIPNDPSSTHHLRLRTRNGSITVH
jgi:DUF4097 and DUF4098 domain-containing protein YvlB